jgi:predicted dehydrogenase
MALFKKAADIKVGCIGYGGAFNMGRAHLKEMQKAGMTPTAVAEIDASRLKVAETDFPGIQTYTDVAAMLRKSDVNLLAIITPHNTHAKLALQCLRAGRHVVAEKPLAITTAECDAMIVEARKRKLVLSTYHNRHWDGQAHQGQGQAAWRSRARRMPHGRLGQPDRLVALQQEHFRRHSLRLGRAPARIRPADH